MRFGLRRSLAIALTLTVLTGCQAPGFMGLNGSATSPDAMADGSHMVRARFRVLVPSELAQGLTLAPAAQPEATRSSMRADDWAVVGAKVFLDGQPNVSDTTDDMGYASLALPQGRLTPVRAEFKTSSGTVSMTALVMIDAEAQVAPIFPITLASTLVMSKIAQHFSYADLAALPYDRIQADTGVVDAALRGSDGSYDPRYLSSLPRQWTVLDTVRAVALLDPILNQALADVLSIKVQPGNASASVAASASVVSTASVAALPAASASIASGSATASVGASDSVSVATGDLSLFAGDAARSWSYDLLDGDGKARGQMVRSIVKASAKADGEVLTGSESGDWAHADHPLTYLMKRSVDGIEFSAAYRPAVNYPLPLSDGQTWEAAPGITAVAHAPAASTKAAPWDDSWRIVFTRERNGEVQSWSEWLSPGVGFTRFQWYDPHSGQRWEARLHPKQDASPKP